MNNKTLSSFVGILLIFLSTSTVHANSVSSPNTIMFENQKITDIGGGISTLTLDIVGLNFDAPLDGAAFSLSWNSLVLGYNSFIADSVWDNSFVDDTNSALGSIDYVFLFKDIGNVGTDFKLGSLSFNVLDFSQLAGTTINIGKDAYDVGFSAEGGTSMILGSYLNSTVTDIPEPNQWSLMIIGLAMMGWMTYRKRLSLAHKD